MKIKITALIILIATFIFANYNQSGDTKDLPAIRELIPMTIGKWQGKDLKVDKAVFEHLEENELLLRLYRNEEIDKTLSLAIVLTDRRDHIHDPEICYRGQGIFINDEKTMNLDKNMSLKVLKGNRRGQSCDVIYWYSDLNRTYSERAVFMKDIVISKFIGKKTKGYALAVIVAPEKIKEAELKSFTAKINFILMNINNQKSN